MTSTHAVRLTSPSDRSPRHVRLPRRAALLSATAALVALASSPPAAAQLRAIGPLPPFDEPDTAHWINSEPLEIEDLRGLVVLVEFWTFGCANCVRSIPWVSELESRYGERGLTVVGVHTPEFDYEKSISSVADFASRHGISHPILIDGEMRYWRALRNRYWPAFYLVDRNGTIRAVHIGETHAGTDRSAAFEAKIETLLAEAP